MAPPRPSTKHSELGLASYDLVEPAKFPKHILRYRSNRLVGADVSFAEKSGGVRGTR